MGSRWLLVACALSGTALTGCDSVTCEKLADASRAFAAKRCSAKDKAGPDAEVELQRSLCEAGYLEATDDQQRAFDSSVDDYAECVRELEACVSGNEEAFDTASKRCKVPSFST